MKKILVLMFMATWALTNLAENSVPFTPELDEYIGEWFCSDNNLDGQWVPKRIIIKKKGKFLKFDFYKNSGKVKADFYDGPYEYYDGHFNWNTSGKYYDIRASNFIKYEFRTSLYNCNLHVLVTKYFYNESGNIDSTSYNMTYNRHE